VDHPADLPPAGPGWLTAALPSPEATGPLLLPCLWRKKNFMQPDWDEQYRIGETPWDKGEAAPPLVAWLRDHPGTMTGTVLVPGCGTGHDVRAIAAAEPDAQPVGLDLSPTAIASCRARVTTGGERYVEADLFALPAELKGTCDWVWEHTCFCAIDPARRDDYVAAVAAALKPGGHLLGIFYLDPYRGDHQPGGGPPHGCTLAELQQRFEGGGQFVIESANPPKACYADRAGRELLVTCRRALRR